MGASHSRDPTGIEAFHVLMRAIYSTRPEVTSCYLPERIAEWAWFHRPYLFDATDADKQVALDAMNLLREAVRDGVVSASGILKGRSERETIGPADLAYSEPLDVFSDQLDCTVKNGARRVFCGIALAHSDVFALAPGGALAKTNGTTRGRYAQGDAPLIEEAKRLLADGKSMAAAADAVADRAAGGGTVASKAKRIARALSKSH